MSTTVSKEIPAKKDDNIENISVINNLKKNSINNNFELNLLEGTEAYYSERYGWTLRRTK